MPLVMEVYVLKYRSNTVRALLRLLLPLYEQHSTEDEKGHPLRVVQICIELAALRSGQVMS